MKMLFAQGPAVKQDLAKKVLLLNWPFLALVTAIVLIGIAALYSVAGGSFDPWASRQVIRYCFGLALLFAIAFSDAGTPTSDSLVRLYDPATCEPLGDTTTSP